MPVDYITNTEIIDKDINNIIFLWTTGIFKERLEENVDTIKKYKNNNVISVHYHNSNIKNSLFGLQDNYIIEFKLTSVGGTNERLSLYKLEHIYKISSALQFKIKILGIERLTTDLLEMLKNKCNKIM